MPPRKHWAPTLHLVFTDEVKSKATTSSSHGCLIADTIKSQYPHLTNIKVDMATIRASDRSKGERYTWLTPQMGQMVLLAFDQGWSFPADELKITRAVKIDPITRASNKTARQAPVRAARIAALEAKESAGTLTVNDRRALSRYRNPKPAPERPMSRGPAEVHHRPRRGGNDDGVTVVGGEPLLQGPAHPNLLRGRDRVFGAKIADPGVAFQEAVDAAVALRLADQEGVYGAKLVPRPDGGES